MQRSGHVHGESPEDSRHITRREILGAGIAAAAMGAAAGAAEAVAPPDYSAGTPFGPPVPLEQSGEYLHAAEEAARWIRSAQVRKEQGGAWLPEPDHPQKSVTVGPDNTIYSGSAGVVLFLLELAKATGSGVHADAARRGADYLAASWPKLPDSQSPGFLPDRSLSFDQGLAGVAFTLAETWKHTRQPLYRDAALAATRRLANTAKPVGAGVEWVPSPAVGLGGGVILYLLYAARTFHDDSLRELAARGGERTLELAERDPRGGLRWQGVTWHSAGAGGGGIPPNAYFPNFELGTAGVAYVLARLYEETGRRQFLEGAEQGARHIERIATVRGDAALVHYREPDLTDLYYLGYCHGPAGTARLFFQLHKVTRERHYLEWTEKLARGIVRSGVPEKLTPGYWNVACQCCGAAAVTELFLSLWLATGKAPYRAFALRVADQLVSRTSDLDGKGYRWYQAWTRVKPWEVTAETGYKIGAAGIGAALLHAHLAARDRYSAVLFPDNPFPAAQAVAT